MRRRLTCIAAFTLLLASAALGADEKANGLGETAHPEGDAIIEAAPRAKQIEPVIVAPVKREVPKTPNIEMSGTEGNAPVAKAAGAASRIKDSRTADSKQSASETAQKVVGDRPNCDEGFKVDAAGTSCVKIASGNERAKKRK